MKNKKTLSIILAVVVVLVAAEFIVPRVYAAKESSDVAAPTIAASSANEGSVDDLNGTWTVGSGSYAGYRVNEAINGASVTVVGRTENVTGDVTIDGGTLTAGTVDVDLASVKTDADRRDEYFRTKAIDTSVYPQATFAVTDQLALDNLGADTQTVKLTGDLTLNGVTKPVTADVQVGVVDGSINVAGSIPLTWSDFNVEAPNLGGANVDKTGSIEFLTVLAK